MFSVKQAVREGLFVEGIEGKRGMGIPAITANLIAAKWEEIMKTEHVAVVTATATYGSVHPIEQMMLGIQPEPFEHDGFRVYPLGDIDYGQGAEGMDLYVANNADASETAIAWCPTDARERVMEAGDTTNIITMVFRTEELDQVLEALGQDFSVLPSELEDAE